MELINERNPEDDDWVVSSCYWGDINYWVQPEITTSYFQTFPSRGSEEWTYLVTCRPESSTEEREGYSWN